MKHLSQGVAKCQVWGDGALYGIVEGNEGIVLAHSFSKTEQAEEANNGHRVHAHICI